MKKAILLFALLLSAMNIMAQAYEFETKDNTLDDGTKYVDCKTKHFAELNVSSPDIVLEMWEFYNKDKMPAVKFDLSKFAKGKYKNSFAVAKKIRDLALSITEDDIKKNMTINLYLSNGDVLRGTNKGCISTSSLQHASMSMLDSIGFVGAYIPICLWESSLTPRQIQTEEKQQVICQQLRTYDIVKIEVDGVSFDVRGLRSAATFDAMFNALAAKTGKGHLYRYNSSSSSSNVSSGPSASCELGHIAVYSDGAIRCRVDNFRIVGAKGKDVEVNAIFEDVSEEFVNYGFLKRFTSIPNDDCTYDEFRVRGKVNELAKLKRYNSGRFKVYIEVEVDNRVIFTSNAKYISIYKDGDSWRQK